MNGGMRKSASRRKKEVTGSGLYILVCCGISPGRVSQIQTEIERELLDRRLKEIIEDYEVKP